MRHPSSKPGRRSAACGIHSEGRDDHMEVIEPILRSEEAKLQRRIGYFCRPKRLLGYFALSLRRRRLLRKLRARFAVPNAMFFSQGIASGQLFPSPLRPTSGRAGAAAGASKASHTPGCCTLLPPPSTRQPHRKPHGCRGNPSFGRRTRRRRKHSASSALR